LLNGPPGVGKSAPAAAVLTAFGSTGRLAVLEHDAFAEMAGAHFRAAQTWEAALQALIAAAKAYLEAQLSTLVVVNYGRDRKAVLERLLAPYVPRHVVILPPWATNRERTHDRVAHDPAPRLPHIGWEAHGRFYEDLTAMAQGGEFTEVITSARMSPDAIAARLALHLGLPGAGQARAGDADVGGPSMPGSGSTPGSPASAR
jgi:AAA domain